MENNEEKQQQQDPSEEGGKVVTATTQELADLIVTQVQEGLQKIKASYKEDLTEIVNDLVTANLKNRVVIQEPKKLQQTDTFSKMMEQVKANLAKFA